MCVYMPPPHAGAIRSGGPERLSRIDLSYNQAGTAGAEALAIFLLGSATQQPGPKLVSIKFDSNGEDPLNTYICIYRYVCV